jgi:pyrimidine and pyridine-specific 5'-nucleotidase
MPEQLLSSLICSSVEMRQVLELGDTNDKDKTKDAEYIEVSDSLGHRILFLGHAGANGRAKFASSSATSEEPVFFIDLDNTLYPKSSGIDLLMARRIELYFMERLGLPQEESARLGARFYKDYGLAIKGLIKHFSIDPEDYDQFVDGGLPLDAILSASKPLQQLFSRLNNQVGPCWVFTNAGKSHAMRVLRLLGLANGQYFRGVIYCDYAEPDFPAKPDLLAFERAMLIAGLQPGQPADRSRCVFLDDSRGNNRVSTEFCWKTVHVDEDSKEDHSLKEGKASASMHRLQCELETLNDLDPAVRIGAFTILRLEDADKLLVEGGPLYK